MLTKGQFIQKGLFETLLATLFRPHNAYCIFMDSKADPGFKTIVNQLINCYKENFPNVKKLFSNDFFLPQ